jgi:cytoskeletal protein RodZ
MDLRGFDSYEISLGDEMRGERASLGKSLEDAERDMRIKAKIITAIENSDLSGFPNQSVIAGYVRSYARYLGMDAEDCFRRFCTESGYSSPAATMRLSGKSPAGNKDSLLMAPQFGDQIAQSRFALTPAAGLLNIRVPLGALTSTAALLALICGLAYGGYALMQDIQRVGFAPLPEAPAVMADAPLIESPDVDTQSLARPAAGVYEDGGTLAILVAPAELPPVGSLRRDGPINAIDPKTAGIFPETVENIFPAVDAPDNVSLEAVAQSAAKAAAEAETVEIEQGVALRASEDTWVRIRGDDNAVFFEGTLIAGDQVDVPDQISEPVLKVGNAGGVFIVVDGVVYGPVGDRGKVVRNVSLRAEDVRSSMPQAEPEHAATAIVPETSEQRAEVAPLD